MRKIFAFVFVLSFILSFSTQAQMTFGVKAGLNMANASVNFGGEKLTSDGIMGFHVGGILEMELTKEVYFQPGLLISQKGYELSDFDASMKPIFIEIPLNIGFRYHQKREDWGIFAQAGPFIGYGVAGKTEVGGESESIKFGSDEGDGITTESDDLKPLDFGINAGLGFEYNNLFATLTYGLGFANLTPGGDGDNGVKFNTIGISLGYKFGK
jgi:hypothetical protein